MFTLSVAFLFFSASSFELLNTLVLKGFDKIIGADIYVFAAVEMILNEGELSTYLQSQQDSDERLVEGYAYSTVDLSYALKLASDWNYLFVHIYDASNFAPTYYVATRMYGLPQNYF